LNSVPNFRMRQSVFFTLPSDPFLIT
jgi:hypothetical protein